MAVERYFTSLQSGPGFQSHWSPLLSHPSVSESRQREKRRGMKEKEEGKKGWLFCLDLDTETRQAHIHVISVWCVTPYINLQRGFDVSISAMHYTWSSVPAASHWPTHPDTSYWRVDPVIKPQKKCRHDSLSLSPTHSPSRRELCGAAALCRKSSLGAVAPVLGSEPTTLSLPRSSSPLPCADLDLSACSHPPPSPDTHLGLFECHTGGETGVCRIKDFDWLSRAA